MFKMLNMINEKTQAQARLTKQQGNRAPSSQVIPLTTEGRRFVNAAKNIPAAEKHLVCDMLSSALNGAEHNLQKTATAAQQAQQYRGNTMWVSRSTARALMEMSSLYGKDNASRTLAYANASSRCISRPETATVAEAASAAKSWALGSSNA